MNPAQVLFLDLDSTLLDNEPHYEHAIVGTCRKIASSNPELSQSQLVEANSIIWQDYWAEVESKWRLGDLDGASVSLEAWRRTLQACGCNDESTAHLAYQTAKQLGRQAYRLFDDVLELFTVARKAGIPLALITNGASDTQREKLSVLGIEHWFNAIVISGEVGVAKPDPAVFDLTLANFVVEPQNVWHVGDNLMTDVGGAQAAGLTAVWLNRTESSRADGDPEPDIEIHALSNLTVLLRNQVKPS